MTLSDEVYPVFAKALGLPIEGVTEATIRFLFGQAVYVDIRREILNVDTGKLENVSKTYMLEKIK